LASAWVELDASGRISELQWHSRGQTLSESVREAIEHELRARPFQISPQAPQASRYATTVDVETWLEEDGDDLRISLRSLRTGIGYLKLRPPRYPQSGLRRGQSVDLLASVAVDTDGRAARIDIRSSAEDAADFHSAVEQAIKSWRFRNEQVDGQPVEGTLNIPIRFSMHCSRGESGFELDAPAPSPLVEVKDNPTRGHLIEVTASRMRSVKPCDPPVD
jgi:TonB family protein